ncbi:MAG: hypothetical protein K2G07_02905 [Muribaculaceae bacterium]|nr:hypothetical protein [Muribaculaceae bacterium]
MKRTLSIIAAAVLLLLLGYQLGRWQGRSADSAATPEQEAEAIDEEALTSAECEGASLDSIYFTDYKGERVAASAYAGDGTIIARFSTSACRPCVNALTASLMRHAAAHPAQRYLILLKNIEARDLYVLQPDFGPQFALLSCDSLPVDFNDGETPVLFQLDDNGRVYNHFTCRYGDYDRTDRYLDEL